MTKENEVQVRGQFKIFDPATGKTPYREMDTTYYQGDYPKDTTTIIRKSLKQCLADISKLKGMEAT